MSTARLAMVSFAVFLVVVSTVWYSYDMGYSAAQQHQIATYNDGFIDGQNNNVPR